MIRINLLPVKAAQKKEMLRGQLVILLLSVILVVVACAGVYISIAGKVTAEKEEIARTESEIISLKKAIGEVGRFKNLQKELQGKLDVLEKLKEGQTGPVHLLDELSMSLPEKLWIVSYKESKGSISIQGLGLDEATVAQFLRDLEASPYYRGVELKVIEQATVSGRKLQKFDVTCQAETPAKETVKK